MAHSKFDLVQETSTSTGAVTMALAGAVTRRRRFGDVLANADTCYVFIEHASAAEWQICLATWNTGHSLTLGAVLASSTGVAVTFSAGTKTISIVAPAAKSIVENNNGDAAVTRDAAIGRNATVAGTLGVTGAATLSSTLAVTSNVGIGTTPGAATVPGTNVLSVAGGMWSIHATAGSVGTYNTTASHVGAYIYSANGYAGMAAINNAGAYTSDIMRFTSGGAVAILSTTGQTVPGTNILTVGGGMWSVHATNGSVGTYNTTASHVGAYLFAANGYSGIATIDNAGAYTGNPVRFTTAAVSPGADNTISSGTGSLRWSVVYAGTGTINTSGREAKLFIGEANTAEKRAAATIKAKPRRYKLKDSVDEKGEARARWHFSYVAEDVRDALAAEGLDPWAYAFLCSDPLIKRETYFETATRAKMRKVPATESAVEIIDGKPVMVAKQVERDEPVGVMVAVVDEAGQPVMQQTGADETTGEPIMSPMMHLVPEMEEYEVEKTREVDTGEVRLGLRYSELEAFLRSAD